MQSSSREVPVSPASPRAFLPLIAPEPPKLSRNHLALQQIEEDGIYSNYGPVNTRFESQLIERVFREGSCVTVCNATLGLMLSIRSVIGEGHQKRRQYALMPSFTFAATAQAALWCGLTPLFCDIDPDTWLLDAQNEQALLSEYAGQIAVIVPYATFGNNLDLARYERLSEEHDIPVVVDAAASLGSLDDRGCAFGTGFRWPVVFSMHATKPFAVGEGGFVYCADPDRIARIRCMGNFGFGKDRSASTIGLNAKLSEVAALTATLQLRDFEKTLRHRDELAAQYTALLHPAFTLQAREGQRQVHSFLSVLLPEELAAAKSRVLEALFAEQIGAGSYFSPHLAAQPFFRNQSRSGPLPRTADISSRIISLPLRSGMNCEHVRYIAASLRLILESLTKATDTTRQIPPMPTTHPTRPNSIRAA